MPDQLSNLGHSDRCPGCGGAVQWHPMSEDFGVCSVCGLEVGADPIATVPDVIKRSLTANADVAKCADCSLPTNWAVGTYWLAPDELWAEVVGTDTIVLCPLCFVARAEDMGLLVAWSVAAAGQQNEEATDAR